MYKNFPRVSIGLPVYNGENFLKDALDSILAQSYKNFELIISDNASTDATPKICKEYSVKDNRIRYYRSDINLGAAKNFNYVFELSRGEYFKWAAHDDVLDQKFLVKCIRMLDNNPSIVLCSTKTRFIDEDGRFLYNYEKKLDISARRPSERLHDLSLLSHGCYLVFGVVRSEVLRKTQLIGSYTSSDRVLLGELSLHGPFFEIPEYLFSRRNHQHQSIRAYRNAKERALWFDPSKSGKRSFSTWRIFTEYCRAIKRSPLDRDERMSCWLIMKKWAQGHWKGFIYCFYDEAIQLLCRMNVKVGQRVHVLIKSTLGLRV